MSPRRDPYTFQIEKEYAEQIEERQETEERIDAKIISTREKEKRIPRASSIIKPPPKNWMVDTEAEAEKELGYQARERMEAHKTTAEEGYIKYVRNVERKEAELSQQARTLRIRARYKESKGDPITAGHLYTQSAFLRFVKGGYSALVSYTMPHRVGETIEATYKAVTQPVKTARLAKLRLETDPYVTFEVAGGVTTAYIVGKGISKVTQKIGISKPRTMQLERKTVRYKDIESPATLMPRGTTRTPWKFGGTAITQLKEKPSYVEVWAPKPVYQPRAGYIIGGIGSIASIQKGKEELRERGRLTPEKVEKQVTSQVKRLREKEMFATGEITQPITEIKQETVIDIIPVVDFPPEHFPFQVQYPRRVQLQKPIMKPLQQLVPKTQVPTYTVPREFLKKKTITLKRRYPFKKEKVKGISLKQLFTGEKRGYPIKDPRKFLEDIW